MFANWSRRKKSKLYEFAFWSIVKSTIERQWEDNVKELAKMDDESAKEFMSKGPKHWTKAFFWNKKQM